MADAIKAPVGSGLARTSMNLIQAKKDYQEYAIDAQSNGDQPLPFDKWLEQQQMADEANRRQQTEGYESATK